MKIKRQKIVMYGRRQVIIGKNYTIDIHGPVKVMIESDGYLMVRRNRCLPFIIPVKDFFENVI